MVNFVFVRNYFYAYQNKDTEAKKTMYSLKISMFSTVP